jgi:hypothetical protein
MSAKNEMKTSLMSDDGEGHRTNNSVSMANVGEEEYVNKTSPLLSQKIPRLVNDMMGGELL